MNRDDQDAGLAHQAELEQRRFDEEQALLKNDPDYLQWLESLNAEVISRGHDEVRRQRIEVSESR